MRATVISRFDIFPLPRAFHFRIQLPFFLRLKNAEKIPKVEQLTAIIICIKQQLDVA